MTQSDIRPCRLLRHMLLKERSNLGERLRSSHQAEAAPDRSTTVIRRPLSAALDVAAERQVLVQA